MTPSSSPETAAGFASAQLILKPRRARPFYARHPWVLQSAIERIEGTPQDGEVVDLLSESMKFIARGIYNSRSKIVVRLYTWDIQEPLTAALWQRRCREGFALRQQLGYVEPQGAARIVNSEADGLSGLTVDRFGEYLSVQATGLGLAQRLDELIPTLVELTGAKGVQLRTEKGAPQAEGIELRDGLLWGELPSGPIVIEEHGIRYRVDLIEGQKTGFYLDQRENRRAVAAYCGGRRVLDMFCYSGGFGLNALVHGRAASVRAFDSSPKAVALAQANAELNHCSEFQVEQGEGFDVLHRLAEQNERFGVVVLDPPKFARSRQSLDEALRAYHKLNRLGADLVEPGGILVTCSCSGHVLREDFLAMLSGVAQQSRRELQILEQRGASPDHPVRATCLENEYLKCFICRVV